MWQALVKYGPAHESAWAGSSSAGDISMQRWPIANADMMQKEEVRLPELDCVVFHFFPNKLFVTCCLAML